MVIDSSDWKIGKKNDLPFRPEVSDSFAPDDEAGFSVVKLECVSCH